MLYLEKKQVKKQFLFNIILLIVLNALIKPFWVFGIDRTVQNVVGPEAYGLYFALFNFALLFNALLDSGITNFNNRSISQTPDLIKFYFPRLILIKLILALVYLIICLGTALAVGYTTATFKLLAILTINQILASILLFLRSNISGLQLFFADSFLSVADRFLMIVLCSMLLWTNLFNVEISIWVFAWFQTLAYAMACFLGFVILLKNAGRFNFRGVPVFSIGLLRQSLPFALLALLMVGYNRIDGVLLERMLANGARAAGIYAQSYRVFDAVNMISVLFASLLLPMFARLLAAKADIKPLVKLSFSILFSGTIVLAITFSYFSNSFLNALYHESFEEGNVVFILLMLSIIPVSLSYIFGTLLTADGRLFILNLIAGIALLVNVGLNLFLIPELNIKGAAIAAFVSQFLVAVFQAIVCTRKYSFNISWIKFVPFVLLVLFTILIAFVFDHLQVNILLKTGLTLIASLTAVFILKIIDIQEIYALMRSQTTE